MFIHLSLLKITIFHYPSGFWMPKIHQFSLEVAVFHPPGRRTRVAVGAEHHAAPGRDRRHLGGVRGGCAGAD